MKKAAMATASELVAEAMLKCCRLSAKHLRPKRADPSPREI